MNLFGVGLPEMAVILVVGLLIFGPRKLPEIGRTVAKTIKSLQSASKEFEAELRRETSNLDKPAPKAVAAIEANTEASTSAATNATDNTADAEVTTETEVVAAADTLSTDSSAPNEAITDDADVADVKAAEAAEEIAETEATEEVKNVSIPEPQTVA